jgi:16S rRNA (guanine966-N2)-methyltransferase
MRIVAGEFKGRKILTPNGSLTRPIMDRVKVSLFDTLFSCQRPTVDDDYVSILQNAEVLDLFAGGGSWGLEALSRGAARVTFIDQSVEAISCLQKNIQLFAVQSRSLVKRTNSFHYLKNSKSSYDLIFCDPPQMDNLWFESLRIIAENPILLKQYGLIVVKLSKNEFTSVDFVNLNLVKEKSLGSSLLLFFEK